MNGRQITSNGLTSLEPPSSPGQWTLAQIQQAISRKLPREMIATRKQGKSEIPYIPWHTANQILDKYAPGWTWEIRQITHTADRLFLIGRLTIATAEGSIYREATGTELLKEERRDQEGNPVRAEVAFGDPSSNAESMAFRRAAARFGLGLYLYSKER